MAALLSAALKPLETHLQLISPQLAANPLARTTPGGARSAEGGAGALESLDAAYGAGLRWLR